MFSPTVLKAFVITLCVFSLTALSAQRDEWHYRSTIRPSVGLSGWQLAGYIDNLTNAKNVFVHATPTYGFQYDFAPVKWFSIGGSYTYNHLRLGADNVKFNIGDKEYEGAASAKLVRHNLGVRLLGHYYNKGKWDVYSGMKIGANIYRGTGKVDSPNFTEGEVVSAVSNFLNLPKFISKHFLSLSATRPTFQVIPLAVNYYVSDNIGIGLETAIGPTQYIAAQANIRF